MSGWGIYDAKTIYGTSVSVTNGSTTVDGVGTQFTANLSIGDVIGIHSDLFTKNRVASIANNTTLTLADPFLGTSNTSLPISFVKQNQQPKYVYQNGGNEGLSSYDTIQKVYGVDVNEIAAGGANVVAVAVVSGGSKYKEVPTVTFSTGSAAATAVIRNGAVANVSLTATGNSYSSAPVVTIGAPYITFSGTSSAVSNTAETITYTGHLYETGDAAVYTNGGGTSIGNLTSGNTYYVIKFTANAFALANSAADATANVQINLTAGAGAAHKLTLTSGAATAVADLGVGTSAESQAAHAGWVKKTIGTGGRAGRIQYETLVASGTITGDAVDDLSFPDA